MAGNSNKARRNSVDDNTAAEYANEVYQAFMAGYVKRINESTLRVPIGGVRIGSAKYSRLAQINLKTRIITFSRFAIENVPERGRRYLVLHELAHVKEPSHNKYFWSLVGEHEPDYKKIGKELEKAFHQNVRAESRRKSPQNLLLPLIRTSEQSYATSGDESSSPSVLIRPQQPEGLLYPLDSGVVEDEFYSCNTDEFNSDAFDAFEEGLMYGGSDLTDELPEEYLDHI